MDILKRRKVYTIYYNQIATHLKNGKWPKRYRFEHINPGIVNYDDIGEGDVFVGSEALASMNPSYIGKPIVNELHQDLTPEQAYKISNEDLEAMADGVVYDVGVLPNGWSYCDAIIWEEETQKNIEEKGYSCSCAYIVEKQGKGGTYENKSFDTEVLNGVYTHMAVVDNPRYKDANVKELPSTYTNSVADEVIKIIKNSKGEKDMIKVFKYLFNSKKLNNADPKDEPKKEEKDEKEDPKKEEMKNTEGAMIDVDGQMIPLEEAVNAYNAAKENGVGNENVLGPDDEVEVADGERVNVSDLISAYQAGKQNAEPPADTPIETVVETEKTVTNNKPNKSFKVVKNAVLRDGDNKKFSKVSTKYSNYERGADRYGSNKENK